MTPLLAATLHEDLPILAALLAASAGVWIWIYRRWRRGEPIIPLARRRPVPWQAQDVLLVFLVYLLLLYVAARVVHAWVGTDVAQPASQEETKAAQPAEKPGTEQKKQLSHPAEQLLRTSDPGAVAVAVTMAIIVAPLYEEFLFRVLLQGWLEAVWSRRRRKHKGLRKAPAAWVPIVLPAVLFALLHARGSRSPESPQVLIESFLGQTAAVLLTIGVAIVVLRFAVGATAADLGWKPEKLGGDARLGLWALLAVMPPVLAIQLVLMVIVKVTGVEYAPDPLPLFVLALVFGVLYRRTHRIVPSLTLHVAFNATSILLLFAGK